jgi:hypothetical protein
VLINAEFKQLMRANGIVSETTVEQVMTELEKRALSNGRNFSRRRGDLLDLARETAIWNLPSIIDFTSIMKGPTGCRPYPTSSRFALSIFLFCEER